jgi:glycosyltransferase involved in cell wall biosynthesis
LWLASGPKERIVVTVAAVQSDGRLRIKGIDILFEVARKLPQIKFVLIGFDAVRFKNLVPPTNLNLYPVLDQSKLLQYYRRAKVYCQPSRREGLSNALCEAMLCECIPVVTDVGGSSRAVGETGIVVRPNDSAALAAAVEAALGVEEDKGRQARERIIGMFPKEKREKRLKELIREISR